MPCVPRLPISRLAAVLLRGSGEFSSPSSCSSSQRLIHSERRSQRLRPFSDEDCSSGHVGNAPHIVLSPETNQILRRRNQLHRSRFHSDTSVSSTPSTCNSDIFADRNPPICNTFSRVGTEEPSFSEHRHESTALVNIHLALSSPSMTCLAHSHALPPPFPNKSHRHSNSSTSMTAGLPLDSQSQSIDAAAVGEESDTEDREASPTLVFSAALHHCPAPGSAAVASESPCQRLSLLSSNSSRYSVSSSGSLSLSPTSTYTTTSGSNLSSNRSTPSELKRRFSKHSTSRSHGHFKLSTPAEAPKPVCSWLPPPQLHSTSNGGCSSLPIPDESAGGLPVPHYCVLSEAQLEARSAVARKIHETEIKPVCLMSVQLSSLMKRRNSTTGTGLFAMTYG